MSKGKKVLKFLVNYLVITLASVLYALGFCWFYQANGISAGGFAGVSQILNHLFPVLPIGITTIALNIPLFIAGAKIQGIKIMIQSLYCTLACFIFVDLIPKIHSFSPIDDLLLASIFGGVTVGIAAGLQMRVGATNGGSELMARLLKYKFHHISVGRLCLIIDLVVIISYAITFQKINVALYGIISMYVLSITVDFVIYGGTHAKMAYIISDNIDEIRLKLLTMDLGLTLIDGRGGWKGNEKKMALCAFKRHQIAAVKSAVVAIDPQAFVIVCDAYEVLGEGFHTYSQDDL